MQNNYKKSHLTIELALKNKSIEERYEETYGRRLDAIDITGKMPLDQEHLRLFPFMPTQQSPRGAVDADAINLGALDSAPASERELRKSQVLFPFVS